MSAIKLSTPSSGSISLSPADTASNLTITVPAVSGTMATLTTPSFATTIGVGGATAAASGAGITFPATQSASTDANTLDDYEEGTWTPTLANTGAGAYDLRQASYVKIGKQVTCCGVVTKGSGTVTSEVTLTGLPFTSNGDYGSAAANSAGGFTVDSGRVNANSTTVILKASGSEITSGTSSWNITFSISYIAQA
jgi:hypothetical protein